MSIRAAALVAALGLTAAACGSSAGVAQTGAGGAGGGGGGGAGGGGGSSVVTGMVVISAAAPVARTATLGVNYWTWVPSYGNNVAGTESAVADLRPAFLRVGGHNNDNNSPSPFDGAQIDTMVTYARAVHAQPILQVPLLADAAGAAPTADSAAAMVTYANVTKSYAITWWSIGNEPDLYPDQEPTRAGYTAQDFCAAARAFVPAMRAVDPTIKIIGPDLSWKYQPGNDWLTPILTGCGELFDVVSIHRYPFAPTAATAAAAVGDAAALKSTIARVRTLMTAAGAGGKPLALTETNITYDGSPQTSTLDASPGTLPAGLWTADMLGTALVANLWSTMFWSTSEGWTLGLLTPPPDHTPRPAYWAIEMYARHFGPSVVEVTSAPPGVHAYASRDGADSATEVMVVNWNATPAQLTFMVTGTSSTAVPPTFVVDPLSMTAIELGDTGVSQKVFMYGQAEAAAGAPPATPGP
jgi:hypothetical protein